MTWSLLIAIVGALVWAIPSNAKAAELGRIAYFVGLLWFVYAIAHGVVRLP
jgi:hypothetical protein